MVLSAKQTLDRALLRIVDGGLAGVIFLVPLLMGGRHAIGHLALSALAVATALAWAVRQSLRNEGAWRPPRAALLLLLGAALVGLQIVPLPPWLLSRLAPHTAEVLPLWNTGANPSSPVVDVSHCIKTPGSLGYWPCLSFTPAETLGGLVIFLDFALLFLVVVERIRHVEDVERLLQWCAMSAVLMASFGIVQLVAGNGKFFWFHEHPFTDTFGGAKGSFSNRNHFAQFLALGVGPLIWWLQDAVRHRPGHDRSGFAAHGSTRSARAEYAGRLESNGVVWFVGLALAIVLFAGLLSLSRGGVAAILLAATTCMAICFRTVLNRKLIVALAGAGLLIGISLAIFGLDHINRRLEDVSFDSMEKLDRSAGRRAIWAAALQAIPDSLWFGTGVGSFREVYPIYSGVAMDNGIEYTHAENSPLQEAVETGVVGLTLTLAAVALLASWCIAVIWQSTSVRLRTCAAAISASLAASAGHCLVDFVWYVPACMAIVAILAACALRLRQMRDHVEKAKEQTAKNKVRGSGFGVQGSAIPNRQSTIDHPPSAIRHPQFFLPRFAVAWPVVAVVLTCAGAPMIANRIGPGVAQTYWDEYLVARAAVDSQTPADLNPRDEAEMYKRWIACLENVVQWQPTHASAHLALGECHRRLFETLQAASENPMSLANIHDAAMQSQFPSREALTQWLSRAVGRRWTDLDESYRHIRAALALCPIEGRAYIYLADLSFLVGADEAINGAYIAQALRVRPFDGSVLYASANAALLAGNREQWIQYLKRACQSGARQQRQVLANLVAGWPDDNLPALIESILGELQPDRPSANFLNDICVKRCSREQLTPLTRYRVQLAETEASKLGDVAAAARVWLDARRLHDELGESDEAARCVNNALQCDPGSYEAHYQAAICLLQQEMFAQAESQVRWCLQRAPVNENTAHLLREAIKGRLDGRRRAAEKGESVTR